jgi:predicted ATP-dependent serine protease
MKSIEDLKKEIDELKVRLGDTEDFVEQIKIKRDISKLKMEAYELALEDEENKPFITAYELLQKKHKKPTFWETGYHWIDKMGGIPKGAFIQFGASSESGKTTMLIATALRLANYKKIMHFNFEMSEQLLAKKIRQFDPTEKQLKNYLIDNVSNKLDDLKREIELHIRDGVEFFIIDSKMKIRTNAKSTYENASLISKELSLICQRNEITIILINQMSEESQRNGSPALKESGDQVYDADVVWFLMKPILKKGKEGDITEFDETFRRFIIFKNRYETGKYYVDVKKFEIVPTIKKCDVYEVETPII